MAFDREKGMNIYTAWTLDPSGAIDGLAEINKELLKTERNQRMATRLGKELGIETQKTGKIAERAGKSFAQSAKSVALWGGALALAYRTIQKNMSTVLKWDDWIGSQPKKLNAMRDATNGVAGALDLAAFQVRVTTGEVRLSTKQQEAAAKAAVMLTRVLKIDMKTALQQVADALQTGRGSDTIFRKLGYDVEFTGNKSEKSAKALGFLVEKFGDLDIKAANTNERISQFRNRIEESVGMIGTAIIKSDLFTESLEGLGKMAGWVAKRIQEAFDPRGKITDEMEDVAGQLAASRLKLKAMQAQGEKYVDPEHFKTGGAGRQGAVSIGMRLSGPVDTTRIEREISRLEMKQGGLREKLRELDAKRKAEEAALKDGARTTPTGKPTRKGDGSFALTDIAHVVGPSGWQSGGQLGGLTPEQEKAAARAQAIATNIELFESQLKVADAAWESEKAEEAAFQAALKLARGQRFLGKELTAVADGGLAMFREGMASAIVAAFEGQMGIGAAMQAVTKAVLQSVGQQALVKSIFELGMGFATMFTQPAASAAHFKASAIFGAAGIAASAVAGQIPGTGGGVGTGAGGTQPGAAGSSIPDYSGRRDTDSNQPIIVRMVALPGDPSSELIARRKWKAEVLKN